MKKTRVREAAPGRREADEMLPEYDFSRARPNKYAARYAKDSIVITLDPDVAAVFPGAKEANEALRALAGLIQKHRARKAASRQRTST
jgi:hypothetical protein